MDAHVELDPRQAAQKLDPLILATGRAEQNGENHDHARLSARAAEACRGASAALVVLLVLVVLAFAASHCVSCRRPQGKGEPSLRPPAEGRTYSRARQLEQQRRPDEPQGREEKVRDAARAPSHLQQNAAGLDRLYSTADVDPLITGQLYAFADNVRNVYAQRTSHGEAGLAEFSSSGSPGDVGVDVGPYGLEEYGGKSEGYDDGIPEPWRLESTPVRWYAPRQRDHYGIEGPTVYSEGLYALAEPDHDPLMN